MKIINIDDFKYGKRVRRFKDAPNPFYNATTIVDITPLVHLRKKHKLNAMLCYCIQNAGQMIEQCHYDFRDENTIVYYEKVYVNWVIDNKAGLHSYVGIPHQEKFCDFEKLYNFYNEKYAENCEHYFVDGQSLLATTAIINRKFESFDCGYTSDFLRSMLIWGKFYRKRVKYYLNMTFRFNHAFFDGKSSGEFFNQLQNQIYSFKKQLKGESKNKI